jgi:putative ABC transport system permease protein
VLAIEQIILGLQLFPNYLTKNEMTINNLLCLEFHVFKVFQNASSLALKTFESTIAPIATIGLVSLPGMMTGQILGGSLPMTAIKYQIAIMLAIFGNMFYSVVLNLIFVYRKSFDKMDRLKIGR